MMKISVITPCHNAGRWIGAALRSVAEQTVAVHEVIVIDDSSTDDSQKQVRASGVDVKLLTADCRSAAVARNIGIEQATGDWIAFLDADDIWYPQHVAQATELLDGSQSVGYMANHHWLRGEDEVEPIAPNLQPKIEGSHGDMPHMRFIELLSQGFHFGHSTVMLRLDRVREVGGFDMSQKRRHDMDLWLRMLCDHHWSWGGEPAAQYRIDTPGSISKNAPEAEYFYLRSLVRNRACYQSAAMDQLIGTAARRAMSLNFVDATWDEYRQARQLAWQYLSKRFQLGYQIMSMCPPAARSLIRIKRKIVHRKRIHYISGKADNNPWRSRIIFRSQTFFSDVRVAGLSAAVTVLWAGIRAAATRAKFIRGGHRVRKIRVKGYPFRIFFREQTSDLRVIRQILFACEYEAVSHEADPKFIIDCGANIGCASIYFLNRYPDARVIAVEPDADNYRVCQMNLAPFGDRVTMLRAGIWSHRVGLRVALDTEMDEPEWAIQVQPCRDGESADIQAIDIETVLRQEGFDRINILKVDIERSEQQVFSHNYQYWLDRTDTIAIELHGWHCKEVFFKTMSAYEYEQSQSGEFTICRLIRPKVKRVLNDTSVQ